MKGQAIRRKTDRCGFKEKPYPLFNKAELKRLSEKANEASIKDCGLTGKQIFAAFKTK